MISWIIEKQQNDYLANVKVYKWREKQIVKITQRLLKVNEAIRVLIKSYMLSKLMSIFIKKILLFLIIKYKTIDDEIKK